MEIVTISHSPFLSGENLSIIRRIAPLFASVLREDISYLLSDSLDIKHMGAIGEWLKKCRLRKLLLWRPHLNCELSYERLPN